MIYLQKQMGVFVMLVEVMDRGQIALPPALMNQMEWKTGDKLNVFVESGRLCMESVESASSARVSDDSFWSEKNQRHLMASIRDLEAGRGEEHELIDA